MLRGGSSAQDVTPNHMLLFYYKTMLEYFHKNYKIFGRKLKSEGRGSARGIFKLSGNYFEQFRIVIGFLEHTVKT